MHRRQLQTKYLEWKLSGTYIYCCMRVIKYLYPSGPYNQDVLYINVYKIMQEPAEIMKATIDRKNKLKIISYRNICFTLAINKQLFVW